MWDVSLNTARCGLPFTQKMVYPFRGRESAELRSAPLNA